MAGADSGVTMSVLIVRMVLSSYARATRCPELKKEYGVVFLHACYAVSGTELAHGAAVHRRAPPIVGSPMPLRYPLRYTCTTPLRYMPTLLPTIYAYRRTT
eukprot:1993840-Rhodomonas_salina.2